MGSSPSTSPLREPRPLLPQERPEVAAGMKGEAQGHGRLSPDGLEMYRADPWGPRESVTSS